MPTMPMMRKVRPLAFAIGLYVPMMAEAQTPNASGECANLAKLRQDGARAYTDQQLPLETRLQRSEKALLTALSCCQGDADCFNVTHFGLACVYEDEYRLLLRKNQREAASQKLVDALNSYERYISQSSTSAPNSTELQLPSPTTLPDDAPACPPATGTIPKGKPRQQYTLNQALTGRDRLVIQVRPTHGRLLVQFPSSSLSFHINEKEYVVVKRPERPLPVWLPQGRYELTWNQGNGRAVVDLRAGESVTQIIGATETPIAAPIQTPAPVIAVEKTAPPSPPSRPPYGLLIGGSALVVVGAAMGALGIAGLVLDGKCTEPACNYVYDGKVYGGAMLGVGVAALGVGATLLGVGLSRKRADHATAVKVSAGTVASPLGLTAQGAF